MAVGRRITGVSVESTPEGRPEASFVCRMHRWIGGTTPEMAVGRRITDAAAKRRASHALSTARGPRAVGLLRGAMGRWYPSCPTSGSAAHASKDERAHVQPRTHRDPILLRGPGGRR